MPHFQSAPESASQTHTCLPSAGHELIQTLPARERVTSGMAGRKPAKDSSKKGKSEKQPKKEQRVRAKKEKPPSSASDVSDHDASSQVSNMEPAEDAAMDARRKMEAIGLAFGLCPGFIPVLAVCS